MKELYNAHLIPADGSNYICVLGLPRIPNIGETIAVTEAIGEGFTRPTDFEITGIKYITGQSVSGGENKLVNFERIYLFVK